MPTLLTPSQDTVGKLAVPKLSLQTRPLFITVMNLKGGVGKTTTAVHIAQKLSEHGETILVDGDSNRSSISWMDKANKNGLEPDFLVISEKSLAKYAGRNSYYVIDTQARPSEDDIKDLLDISDLIILPTPPLEDDIRVTLGAANLLQQLGSTKHCVLLTKVMQNRGTGSMVMDAQQSINQEGVPVCKSYIRLYEVYSRAFGEGVPVCQMRDGKSKEAWSDYQAVMKEVFDEQI